MGKQFPLHKVYLHQRLLNQFHKNLLKFHMLYGLSDHAIYLQCSVYSALKKIWSAWRNSVDLFTPTYVFPVHWRSKCITFLKTMHFESLQSSLLVICNRSLSNWCATEIMSGDWQTNSLCQSEKFMTSIILPSLPDL